LHWSNDNLILKQYDLVVILFQHDYWLFKREDIETIFFLSKVLILRAIGD